MVGAGFERRERWVKILLGIYGLFAVLTTQD